MKTYGGIVLGVGMWVGIAGAQEIGGGGTDLEALLYGTELVVEAATKRVERAVEAPSNVAVFTYEDLQKLGVQSVLELIRLIPGGDVHLESLLPMATLRGLTTPYANKILFLLDGRPMNMASLGAGYYDLQQPIGPWVKRVEIIKGPGSALYGANAYAGVINIVTREPDSTSEGIYLIGGEQGTGYIEGMNTGRLFGDVTMMVGGRFLFSQGFDPVYGYARDTLVGPNAEHEDEFLRARFTWKNHELSLWGLRNLQGRYGNYRYNTPYDRSRERRIMADWRSSLDLSPDVRLSARLWGDYLDGRYSLSSTVVPIQGDLTDSVIDSILYHYNNGAPPEPIHAIVFEGPGEGVADDTLWVYNPFPAPIGCGDSVYHSSLIDVWAVLGGAVPTDTVLAHQCDDAVGVMDTASMKARLSQGKFLVVNDPIYTTFTVRRAFETQVGGEIQVDFALGDAHYVIAGIQGLYQRVYQEAIKQGETFTGTNAGAYVQWQWQATDWAKILAGLRYDYNSIYGSFVAPRLALVVTPLPRLVAKAMYGQAFRAPNYVENYVDQPFVTAQAEGNPDLLVEKIQTFEFFASYTPSRYLKVEATTYYNVLNDMIWSTPTLQPLFGYFPAIDPTNFPIPGVILPSGFRQIPTHITYENYPQTKQLGVEARLESRPTAFLHLFVDGTYMKFDPSDTARLYFLDYFTSNANAGFTVMHTLGDWTGSLTLIRHFQGGRNVHFWEWKSAGLRKYGFLNLSAALRYRFLEFRVMGYNILEEKSIFNPYPWEEYKLGQRDKPTEEEQFYPDARRLIFQVRLQFNL